MLVVFKAAFMWMQEKSKNIKVHRNGFRRAGSPCLRMSCGFWIVSWSLSISVRGSPIHLSFCSLRAVGRPLLNGVHWWGGKPLPQRLALASQSQSSLRQAHTPCPHTREDGMRLVRSWGSVGGVSCHSSSFPAVPYLVAFDRTTLSCSWASWHTLFIKLWSLERERCRPLDL